MQFSVEKSALSYALTLVAGVVERKTTIPILSNVKLCATGADSLTITGTDLENSLSIRIAAKVETPGVVTLPAKKLDAYTKLLGDGEVRFKIDERSWASISAGRARTRISGMSADSFPEIPAAPGEGFQVPAATLVKLVNRVRYAICVEQSRFTMNGLLMEADAGVVRMVATDGHRLALAEAECPECTASGVRVLVPRKGAENAAKLADRAANAAPVSIAHTENFLFFTVGDTVLTCQKLAGTFPDYARVLPKETKTTLSLNREDLAGAIGRVAQFADERSRAVRFMLKRGEGLEVFASAIESGESTEAVQCEYDGQEFANGLNAGYIAEFLQVVATEAVSVGLTTATGPVELRPEGEPGYRYVVMPMRI